MFSLSPKIATGIHLSGHSIRIVQLMKTRRSVTVNRLGYGETSFSLHTVSLLESTVREDVAKTIGDACDQGDLKIETPVLCLDDRSLLLKRIPLDSVVQKWTSEQIAWEMSQILPGREEYTIDFHLSENIGYAVAIRRTVIDLYLDICHRAGFRPLVIDIHPFALSHTYQSLLKGKRHEVLALLSLEEEITTSMMAQNGKLLCASIIPTDQLESQRETEEIIDDGVEEEEERESHNLVSYLRHLLSETNYARRGPSFDRILLCGEMVDSKKHLSALASESQTPPEIVAPFDLLEIDRIAQERDDLLMQGHLFTVALGLAYRGLEER